MKTKWHPLAAATLAVACLASVAVAKSQEQEDWEAARKATCPELVDAYKTTIASEKKCQLPDVK